ncbi:MAG: HAD-IIIA family hydrolase [Saprospiraceae bacterium]|nr:HAD-IIIA family hydrolase [Saprospiraceae bacterium]MDW8485185.1 HAD-IIIA family hydrolase [Saprospiraceae bacterium]
MALDHDALVQKAKQIRLLLTDCDGVLTDGGVYYSAQGEQLKRFSIRDGMGVERLRKLCAIDTGIVTGEHSPIVARRAEKLQMTHLYLGVKDKGACLRDILAKHHLKREEIAFIGDDVNDLEVLQFVGLSACPADALPPVKAIVHYVCTQLGGHGAFREFAEWIIQLRRTSAS